MDIQDYIKIISESITSNNCIAFIGAGASAAYTDENDKSYEGFPLASGLLELLKSDKPYLQGTSKIEEASFLIKHHEGRLKLESQLSTIFSKKIKPLPCHDILAEIPFCSYVSMNFDELLESALNVRYQNVQQIIKDIDVAHLVSNHTTVVKPHGTISKKESLKIATDEVLDFEDATPILHKYLLSLLANKVVLFIGFGLGDYDFINLITYLKKNLGHHMPKSYAVLLSSNNYLDSFWESHNIKIINSDATYFLSNLLKEVKKIRFQMQEDLEPWMKNEFFQELMEIRSLPTETEVIEALLVKIKTKIGRDENLANVQNSVMDAINLVLTHRINYSALKKIGKHIDNMFSVCIQEKKPIWNEFQQLLFDRQTITHEINSKAKEVVQDSKNILLYSSSQRVGNLLESLDPKEQSEITLIIGECRPKSPNSFQDSILTAKRFRESNYQIRMIPDMAIFHQIEKGHIDLVLMGAHMVFCSKKGEQKYFINTCGSSAIVEIAHKFSIPVQIIYEKDKEVLLNDGENPTGISYDEEENIVSEAITEISKDNLLSDRTRIINVGYDLVTWKDNLVGVTD